ncbi:hypothetical protein OE88DRAFT_1665701 [Heliocybe sulcata]|uniref:Uncharacterized protein n=1 Tax=Heliocybe sulcata TaxID=5364 RepID=A0A5C3MQJ0_9AGAM|nr:hypothetical protein OE88DRAFT_1665701 [Heliocybe sulcata]
MAVPPLPVSASPKPIRNNSTNHAASQSPVPSPSLPIPVGMTITSPIPLPRPSGPRPNRARPSTAPAESTLSSNITNQPKPRLPPLTIPASRPASWPHTPPLSPPATRTKQALRLLGGANGMQRVRSRLRRAYCRNNCPRSPGGGHTCANAVKVPKPIQRRHSKEHDVSDLDLRFAGLLLGEPLPRRPKQKSSLWADKDYLVLRDGVDPDTIRPRQVEKVEKWRWAVANAVAAADESEGTPSLSPVSSLRLSPISTLQLSPVAPLRLRSHAGMTETIAQKPECALTLDLHADACLQAYLVLTHDSL